MREKIERVIKVRLQYKKTNNIWLAIVTALAVTLKLTTGFDWWILLVFLPVYYFIKSLYLKCNNILKAATTGVWTAFSAVFTLFSVQKLLLDPELFAKTKTKKWVWNYLIVLAIYFAFLAVLNNAALTCTIVHSLLMMIAFADYFVYSFRGNELTFADLRSAGTGLSVAANYQFVMEAKCGILLLLSILFIACSWKLNYSFAHRWIARLVCLVIAGGLAFYVASQVKDVNTETWEQKGSYKNGFILNFCLEIRDSFVSAPDGYSVDAVKELETQYEATSDAYATSDTKEPTIIVIMNESFADLSVLGDLSTNIELTPFMDSMTDNVIKGYALSSVYSAKTPNSEWEFMTGNSMAFLPQGSVVYQQFINDEPTSIVSYLHNIGYTCVAMHPYYETGWSRNVVYPTMGFDEMHFIDDFDQTKLLRKYITDEEFFDKIIDRYEESPDKENLFIMGVSMQNHGGYGESYDNMEQYVYKLGLSYTDVNQYLQLVHETDSALEKLITYFENVDDPVEIVFFGDHQPGLNSSFYRMMNGKGLSGLTQEELEELYTVPFFIWTNYESESEDVEITSLNYLSTLALERANIDLPGYNQFLANMMEVIPAINSQAYYSVSDQKYKDIDEAEGEEAEWIENYHILQYNNMFDLKNRSDLFFPYLDDADELSGGLD